MAKKSSIPTRRGVLLLIVLGMLAMFALIGLMFVLTSNQQLRSAKSSQRVEENADPPRQLLRDCIAQILRGATTRTSVTSTQSWPARAITDAPLANGRSFFSVRTNGNGTTERDKIAFGGSVMAGPHSLLETLYGTKARMGQIPRRSRVYPSAGVAQPVVTSRIRNTPLDVTTTNEGQLLLIPIFPVEPVVSNPPSNDPNDDNQRAILRVRPFDPDYRAYGMTISTASPDDNPFTDRRGPCDNAAPVPTTGNAWESLDAYYRRFVGCVFTMVNGPCAGVSTRIVDYIPVADANTPPAFVVLAAPGISVLKINEYLTQDTSSAISYIVNGTPFSGLGVGFDWQAAAGMPGTTALAPAQPISATIWVDSLNATAGATAATSIIPWAALLPNHPVHRLFRQFRVPAKQYAGRMLPQYFYTDVDPGWPNTSVPDESGTMVSDPGHPGNVPGGANVDYTAVDYQHMLLAMVLPKYLAGNPTWTTPMNQGISVPIPSLHRAELLHYWANLLNSGLYTTYKNTPNLVNAEQLFRWMSLHYPEVLYSACMRPIGQVPFHPKFTGSVPVATSTSERVPQAYNFTASTRVQASRFNPFWDGKFLRDGDLALPANTCRYQWDVDNDGDGIPDSVWTDFGLPVRKAANGKFYKPLVAVMCVDMDGRLNLNAHGCLEHTNLVETNTNATDQPHFNQDIAQLTANYHSDSFPPQTSRVYPGGNPGVQAPSGFNPGRGQGYGPADISLRPLLPYNTTNPGSIDDPYLRLLRGNDGTQNFFTRGVSIPGRYGDLAGYGIPGRIQVKTDGSVEAANGGSGDYTRSGAPLYWNHFPEYARNYWYVLTNTGGIATNAYPTRYYRLDAYGTPPDLYGHSALGLDFLGRPVYSLYDPRTNTVPFKWMGHDLTVSTYFPLPYEINLNNPGLGRAMTVNNLAQHFDDDKPFTPAELERLLRFYDRDAVNLASRIVDLTCAWSGTLFRPSPLLTDYIRIAPPQETMDHAQEITTESWDIPVPPPVIPSDIYARTVPNLPDDKITRSAAPARHVWDLLRMLFPKATHDKLAELLPQEVLMGQRMDINRPFGVPRYYADPPTLAVNNNAWHRSTVDNPREDWLGTSASATTAFFRSLFEPANSTTGYWFLNASNGRYWYDTSNPGANGPIYFDPSNGKRRSILTTTVPDPSNGTQARQLYARYLYVLACVTCDVKGLVASASNVSVEHVASDETGIQLENAARMLAQWAINVVDFRDRDSIQTPFAYDLNLLTYVYKKAKSETPPADWRGWRYDKNPTTSAYEFLPVYTDDLKMTENTASAAKFWTHVVWGCERPELLITETIALHDRRTSDLPAPAGVGKSMGSLPSPTNDPHFDQRYRPEGSLFFELYNPWNPQDSPAPELHTLDTASTTTATATGKTNDFGVDLTLVTPVPGPNASTGDPVWRVVVADPVYYDASDATQGTSIPTTNNASYSPPDPDSPSDVDRRTFYGAVDRSVYFAFPPTGRVYDEYERANLLKTHDWRKKLIRYYPSNPAFFAKIKPGRYGVVGPRMPGFTPNTAAYQGARQTTYLGLDFSGSDPTTNGTRQIQLLPQANSEYDSSGEGQVCAYLDGGSTNLLNLKGSGAPATSGAPPLAPNVAFVVDYVQTVDPDATTATPFSSSSHDAPRLSLTEPFCGYPNKGAAYFTTDSVNMALRRLGSDVDTPFDYNGTYIAAADQPRNDPAVNAVVMNDNVACAYRVLYLQRLADPTRPWNPYPNERGYNPNYPVNPYRTIDSMAADLTAFNGADKLSSTGTLSTTETPGTVLKIGSSTTSTAILSRERGEWAGERKTNKEANNLWMHNRETYQLPAGSALQNTSTYVVPPTPTTASLLPASRNFRFTLGMLNDRFWKNPSAATNFPGNTAAKSQVSNLPAYYGAPYQPFPWLTWNNRPYISPLELLQVPAWSSSRLLLNHEISFTASRPYILPAIEGSPNPVNLQFNHLMPWLASSAYDAATPLPQLYRMLEYLGVPSRFAGTATQIDPVRATNSHKLASNDATISTDTTRAHRFHPPFNWISNYREPGRINLNSVNSKYVWNGLMNGFPDQNNASWETTNPLGPAIWQKFLYSRRGYKDVPGTLPDELGALLNIRTDSTSGQPYPTRFENPFRSFAGACLVPPIPNTATNLLKSGILNEINTTVMRADPTALDYPLFAVNANTYPASFTTTDDPHPASSRRNPYFQYQGMQRLSNLTTTRSNVYAVWITIGYFEVFPYSQSVMSDTASSQFPAGRYVPYATWKKFHPDDWELGQELGTDTGEVKRDRAFYLIDRSLPAAFMRGQDFNHEKTILLERIIE